MNDLNNTGAFLKSLRVAKGLTQMELAEYLSVSNKTVSKWESGVGIPEVTTLMILADFYDVTVDDILRGSKRVTKNPQKEANIANYLVSKVKEKYINFFIISLGLWLLSNVAMITLGEVTNNSSLGIGVGILLMVIGVVIQGVNVNHFRMQTKEFDSSLKNNLINKVFHSTYVFLYLSLSTFIFASFYYAGSNLVLKIEHVLYRFIFVYSITLIISLVLYFIVRIKKNSLTKHLKRSSWFLLSFLLLILVTPFIVLTIVDPYDVAINNKNSYVSFSIYKKQNEPVAYYRLLYSSLLNSPVHIEENLTYDEVTTQYSYTFDDGYVLVISNQDFSFINSLDYVKYEISSEVAIGYMIEIPRNEMRYILYTQYTLPLISLYMAGIFIYYLVSKRKAIDE